MKRLRLTWFHVLTSAAILAAVAVWVALGKEPALLAASDQVTERYGEAIVLRGEQLRSFLGRRPDEIEAIDARDHRLLVQVDERDGAGTYMATEDGKLDANDEVVLLAGDAGGPWSGDVLMPYTLGYGVQITDPLGGPDRWIYLGVDRLAFAPADPLPDPAIRYLPPESRIAGASYAMDFAQPSTDGFIGPKGMRFSQGGANLVDRLKIRFAVRTFLGVDTYTEEDIAANAEVRAAEGPPPRIGPLRIVLDKAGVNLAYPRRLTISRGSYEEPDLPLGAVLEDLRMALDLSPAAIGATYRDSRGAAPVTIDGQPDTVASRPLPLWREYSFSEGRLVLLSRASAATADVRQTYDDGTKAPDNDTGDKRLVGQVGVRADSMTRLGQADFPGEMVFLPQGVDLSPERLAQEAASPLHVSVADWHPMGMETATPVATATHATPPSEPTPTKSAPTTTVKMARLWLPWLERR